ncbi:hypothetical protein DB313_06135 (plasmid) [Borrelia turcica IST7]|uniref:Uncharacterized protein n=1 Tax=Borrelia turcica IST7 TaxID=1104446 RepID=A0A386PPP0_9SPIR|nr:hypothetical protein [Borrelia turcica]AYE37078.1 hypothetical protein DB313_06135 [Borrelia turcica IST7]
MSFLLHLFICFLFNGCLPYNPNTENNKETGISSTEMGIQQSNDNSLIPEETKVLGFLHTQLTAFISSSDTRAELKPLHKRRLDDFLQWLTKNPDKGRELVKVGQIIVKILKSKGANDKLDNLSSAISSNGQSLQQHLNDIVLPIAYSALTISINRNLDNDSLLSLIKGDFKENGSRLTMFKNS